MDWRTLYVARRVMPDGRLAYSKLDEDGTMQFWLKAGFIHPALVRDMGALSSQIAYSGCFDLDPSRVGMNPLFSAWIERVPGEDWPPGVVVRPRIGGKAFFEIQCRQDLIRPELAAEMNEQALPAVSGALVPPALTPNR